MNILISGQPNDFIVRIGIGRLIRHIVTATVETLLLTELFLFVDVPEMLWNLEVESKIAKQIDAFVCSTDPEFAWINILALNIIGVVLLVKNQLIRRCRT